MKVGPSRAFLFLCS